MPDSVYYSDTDPRAMEAWIAAQRAMEPGEKFLQALQLTHFAFQVSLAGVREQFPHADDREIFLRAAALRLPRDLMIQAYGWDPQAHGPAI